MLEKRPNKIVEKTEEFGNRVVNMYQYLMEKPNRNVKILKQLLRSGTSIGANIAETNMRRADRTF